MGHAGIQWVFVSFFRAVRHGVVCAGVHDDDGHGHCVVRGEQKEDWMGMGEDTAAFCNSRIGKVGCFSSPL